MAAALIAATSAFAPRPLALRVQQQRRLSGVVLDASERPKDDGRGMNVEGWSRPPNMGGTRVVVAKNRYAATEEEAVIARRLILGVGLLVPAYAASTIFFKDVFKKPPVKTFDEGDAVTAPALELQLDALIDAAGASPPADAEVRPLVTALEESGGSVLASSKNRGKWVIPWVGGWERVWSGQPDVSLFGGPARTSLGPLELQSARHFVYGPGEGGITVEYLFGAAGKPPVLLARQGSVSNLGGNFFQLDFPTALQAYEVAEAVQDGAGRAALTPLSGRGDGAPTRAGLVLTTTYLSERLWVLRSCVDEQITDQVVVFRRTETRSVIDRRGLVAEGQLKPPDDETIRYGRLLFGETLSDYAGWSDAATKDAKLNDILKK